MMVSFNCVHMHKDKVYLCNLRIILHMLYVYTWPEIFILEDLLS